MNTNDTTITYLLLEQILIINRKMHNCLKRKKKEFHVLYYLTHNIPLTFAVFSILTASSSLTSVGP